VIDNLSIIGMVAVEARAESPDGDGVDRRQRRHDAKRANIVAEAWKLARRNGLAAISLRDLAERVDLRQPSLYAYFDSKLALYDAMFVDATRQLLDAVQRLPPADDPREALVEFAEFCIRFATEDVVRHELLFQRTIPGFKPSPAAREEMLAIREIGWQRLQAAGIEDLPTADIFTGIVSGFTNQQVFNDPLGDRWLRQTRRAVEMFLTDVDQRSSSEPTKRTVTSRNKER
jgi:AcrR family transcriptional regulator